MSLYEDARTLLQLADEAGSLALNQPAQEAANQTHTAVHELFHSALGHEQTSGDDMLQCHDQPCQCQEWFSPCRSEVEAMIQQAENLAQLLKEAKFDLKVPYNLDPARSLRMQEQYDSRKPELIRELAQTASRLNQNAGEALPDPATLYPPRRY